MLTVAPSPTFDALSMDASTSAPNHHSLSSRSTGPKPLHLAANDTASSSGPASAPLLSSPANYGSLPSPISPARKTSRRQSSISYFPSNSNVTRDREPELSNLPATSGPAPALTRSQSVRVGSKGDRKSTGSLRAQVDRGPLTLVEKHSDLLHFIAQKESKCLDLRSQLAREEEELLELKRKWEKIVNRGLQRSSMPPTPSGNSGMVQGVGRILAAGLSDMGSSTPPPSAVPKSLRRVSGYGHVNNESTSSASTATTSTSNSTNRLSQSSASSFEDDQEDKAATLPHPSSKTLRRRSKDCPTPSPLTTSPPSSYSTPTANKRLSRPGALPPPSSPGLALLVGKWDQTLSKGSRRASALLSDVFAALGSPPAEAPSKESVFGELQRQSEACSLLDDEDDGRSLGGIMTPDSKPVPKPNQSIMTPKPASTPAKPATTTATNDEEEEWNW
ncbi:hypothetical protein OE88DRAFT_1647735 [Heliocybe sulcata]|uniref:Uncharacterized protein n=1 Tax=Heliocybe sulcata TaxID=5364 RepID=A0A5C3MQP7_9AGAM|nr:hypothetical protein OE88DRAFT_1647735 [Heliocybe sulcata]